MRTGTPNQVLVMLLAAKETIMSAGTIEIPGYIAGTWVIDPVHSHVGFVARHLMVSKVRGSFGNVEGQIITAENPLESSAAATIDTTSLATSNEQRDADVKGENFLDVEHHPAMTYQSTELRQEDGDIIASGGERLWSRPVRRDSSRPVGHRRDRPDGLRHHGQHGASYWRGGGE
jgi:polyisoprenoid-binding protein YceI